MFEVTLFFLFLIDSVQQIIRYHRKGIFPVWAKPTLWARIHKKITEIFGWPCCNFVKGALTQNKRYRHYMFEITFVFPFLMDSVQQIARFYREGICPIWAKYTLPAW